MKKLELTKEQTLIINDLIFNEYLKFCQLKNQKYIDKTQVETQINKLSELMELFNDD